MSFDKIVYIMRGVPGSGKTYWTIRSDIYDVFSADDYFTFYENGKEVYRWDPSKLAEAHKDTQDLLVDTMKRGHGPLALDNTHIRPEHLNAAARLVETHGYTPVEVCFLPPTSSRAAFDAYVTLCAERNRHNVPRATIERMALQLLQTKGLTLPK